MKRSSETGTRTYYTNLEILDKQSFITKSQK